MARIQDAQASFWNELGQVGSIENYAEKFGLYSRGCGTVTGITQKGDLIRLTFQKGNLTCTQRADGGDSSLESEKLVGDPRQSKCPSEHGKGVNVEGKDGFQRHFREKKWAGLGDQK